tara:strand:- start:4848 stop:5024 length:177 start_codon:yes stop_codon:yes gene_type:complete
MPDDAPVISAVLDIVEVAVKVNLQIDWINNDIRNPAPKRQVKWFDCFSNDLIPETVGR